MWFRFPEGIDNISVEQQNFQSEYEDKDRVKYFRAPDHFAPVILDLQGFTRMATPPEGAPPDLPKEDPEASRALGNLASQVDALKQDNLNLREENMALIAERDMLSARVAAAEAKVEPEPDKSTIPSKK